MVRLILALLSVCLAASAQVTFTEASYPAGQRAFANVTGDFDRDGRPDIAITTQGPDAVLIFTNTGSGGFSPGSTYAVLGAAWIRTADVNRDGNLDLVVQSGSDGDFALQVLAGNGDGTFYYGQRLAFTSVPLDFDLGDFKPDGYPDLLVKQCDLNADPSPCRLDYYQNNAGVFVFTTNLVPSGGNLLANVNGLVRTVAFADLNADGHLDAMYTSAYGLTTRFGNGAGRFTSTYSVRLQGAQSFVVNKFNAAVRAPDVVVLSPSPTPCTSACFTYINSYVNDGRGFLALKFRDERVINLLAPGDMDGDGRMDLVIGYGASDLGYLAYMPGDGRGSFGEAQSISNPYTAAQPEVRDLDIDGRHDISYTEVDSGTLTVVHNDDAPVICRPPGTAAVQARICAPAANAAVPSTFTVTGAGNSPAGLLRLELWIDGSKRWETRDDQLRHTVSLAAGRHRIAVVAVDLYGAYARRGEYVYVHSR